MNFAILKGLFAAFVLLFHCYYIRS